MEWNILYLVGVGFALGSLLVSTVALLVQKHAATREAGLPIWRRPRLLCGLLLNLLSEVTLTPFAILYAPLSLISPLGGFGMIFNGLLAHFGCVCGVRERMSLGAWCSTLTMVVGVGMVAVASNDPDASARFDAATLVALVGRASSVVILVSTVGIAASMGCVARRTTNKRNAFALAAAAGILGTFSVFWVKVIMNILAVPNGAAQASALMGMACACLLLSAPSQVAVLNIALKAHPATFVIPVYLSTMTVSMAAVGGIIFDEFVRMSSWRVALFSVGLSVTIVGVVGMGQSRQSSALDADVEDVVSSSHDAASSSGTGEVTAAHVEIVVASDDFPAEDAMSQR